jgi:hypothetical protein
LRKSLLFDIQEPSQVLTRIAFISLIEMQAFMARLVREFQFSEVEGKHIKTWRPALIVPIVVGEENKGPQLPLKVSVVHRN